MRKSFSTQSSPKLRSVKLFCHVYSDIKVAALNGELESCLRVLHKLESNLWVPFLLQVRDDALADETRCLDDLQHLFIVSLDKSEFESILGGVNVQHFRLGGTIQAVYTPGFDSDKVHCLVECSDDAIVSERTLALSSKVFDLPTH